MTTFKLEIDDVTKTPSDGYSYQYCDEIVINTDSLDQLAKLCKALFRFKASMLPLIVNSNPLLK